VMWLFDIVRAWGPHMNAADRTRVILGVGFLFGAVSHFGWLWVNGSSLVSRSGARMGGVVLVWNRAVDFVVFWLLLAHPRAGVAMGVATMVTTLSVNWTQFPTFEYTFNWVLIGLTLFGVVMFTLAPWLWRASRWKLSPTS